MAANVCKKITGRLTSAIAKQEDVSVQLEALDIMADMLSRYQSEPRRMYLSYDLHILAFTKVLRGTFVFLFLLYGRSRSNVVKQKCDPPPQSVCGMRLGQYNNRILFFSSSFYTCFRFSYNVRQLLAQGKR